MKTHTLSNVCALLIAVLSFSNANQAQVLELQPGDRICLVGNTLGERMQHHNYWESSLHQLFPQHQLSIRNLCFPADEIEVRPRSQNFGTPDDHLTHSQADVVMFFFGFNESFQGTAGIGDFKQQLQNLVESAKKQEAAKKQESAKKFVRLLRDDAERPLALQTPVVRYRRSGPDSATIDLVGAIHVGDAAYYRRLRLQIARRMVADTRLQLQ